MAANSVKPPETLKIERGNPSHSWSVWKRGFEIYLKATGSSTAQDEQKVGLLLNHIGEDGLDIFDSFTFLPVRPDPIVGQPPIPAEDPDHYDTVVQKYADYFGKRDPQLMLRERFWFHLKRGPSQTLESWVLAIKKLAAECKFPQAYVDQAVRDKLTFSCIDESSKSKLYDVGPGLSSERAVEILYQKETTRYELQESKSANIDVVHSKTKKPSKPASTKGKTSDKKWRCGYCGGDHPKGKRNCPAAHHDCEKCKIRGHFSKVCHTSAARVAQIVEVDEQDDSEDGDSHVFIGSVTSQVNAASSKIISENKSTTSSKGWYIKLKTNSDVLPWYIDSGAEISVMPDALYKKSYGDVQPTRRTLFATGEHPLHTLGCVRMELSRGDTTILEDVYVVQGVKSLLLGQPAIEKLGLIPDIPGAYRIRAVDSENPKLDTKDDVVKAYPKLFKGLGKLEGEYTIKLKDDAKPFCLYTPRRVPLPLMKRVKEDIAALVKSEVIEPVDEPTDWCAPLVVVVKGNGNLRLCVDLTRLNEGVQRELYVMKKVEETLGCISGGTVFSKLDANSGFHQVPLSKDSAKLTTFITPFGRYMFRRLPYGISSAPEHFQKRMDKELTGLQGVLCHMDDILVIGKDKQEHDDRLVKVLNRLKASGITLNHEKCVFSTNRLHYLGQVIGPDGISKDPKKVKAIIEMPDPKDVPDVRRFLGMVNQQMKFLPNLAEITKPVRDLLKKDSEWTWDLPQKKAFERLKQMLASEEALALYDPERETIVSADASSYGLGAVIRQRQKSGNLKAVAYASRSMTKTECRYAQIEKEALATTWALEHWRDLLIGMQFHVETDHKPLVPLFSTKLIDELPLRIQRFRLRLMRYDFTVSHVPGKNLMTADTLSRAPLGEGMLDCDELHNQEELRKEAEAYVQAVLICLPSSDQRLEEIRTELKKDDILKVVIHHVEHGWPANRRDVYGPLVKFWNERGNLTVHDGLLLRGRQLVIPASLRTDVLRHLHDGHQGITKTRENASSSVWWPGLSTDIEKTVRNCVICEKYRRERVEPMRGTEFPERPWSRVAADFFFHKGSMYLLLIDYYSRDIEIFKVPKTVDTAETVSKMKRAFYHQGIPDVLFSDNGPQFASAAFRSFAEEYRFQHITSSPRYAQSNGEVERAVQTIKAILNKTDDEYLGLLSYRNTPQRNGFSPAQLNMGRKLKTRVPCHPGELRPCTPDADLVRRREKDYRKQMSMDYDRRHKVTEADELSPGDRAWLPDLRVEGKVVGKANGPRSYIISTPNGLVRRNRRMTRNLGPGTNRESDPTTAPKVVTPPTDHFPPGNDSRPVEVTQHPVVSPATPVSPGRGTTLHVPEPEPRRSTRSRTAPKRLIEEH